MKQICPACREKTISFLSKWRSFNSDRPIKCDRCGQQVLLPIKTMKFIAGIYVFTSPLIFVYLLLLFGGMGGLICTVLSFFAYFVVLVSVIPMTKCEIEDGGVEN